MAPSPSLSTFEAAAQPATASRALGRWRFYSWGGTGAGEDAARLPPLHWLSAGSEHGAAAGTASGPLRDAEQRMAGSPAVAPRPREN